MKSTFHRPITRSFPWIFSPGNPPPFFFFFFKNFNDLSLNLIYIEYKTIHTGESIKEGYTFYSLSFILGKYKTKGEKTRFAK